MDNSTVRPGMTDLDAGLMNIFISFPKDRKSLTGDLVISTLSSVLRVLAPVIVRYGGKVSRVSETGITAIFPGDCESALRCAVEFSPQLRADFAVGIHYGSVSMGTVSWGDFSTFIAVSIDNGLARRISETASRLGARILLTDSAAAQIRGFSNRYSCRRLGIIKSAFHDGDIGIYDVYDGDPSERRYNKHRSRLFFEKGVELFLSENWMQARSYFIELLKFDRGDLLAKEYIFKCDRFIADPDTAPEHKYLASV